VIQAFTDQENYLQTEIHTLQMSKALQQEESNREKEQLRANLKSMEISLAELRMQVTNVERQNSEDFQKDLKIMEHEIHNKYLEQM
jgi:hypothetical protein